MSFKLLIEKDEKYQKFISIEFVSNYLYYMYLKFAIIVNMYMYVCKAF